MSQGRRFRRYVFAVFVYTIAVILWGAWVRISHSGNGCGDSWPLCKEQVIPTAAALPTWIEFAHRLSSGLFAVLMVILFFWGRRFFAKGHWGRKAVSFALFFTVTEALLGAALVLFGLVGSNATVTRAYVMALHMFNSLLLSGSIIMTCEAARFDRFQMYAGRRRRWLGAAFLLALVFIACTGALASLSGTLFPSQSLLQGLKEDFARNSHILLRLRIWHPISATILGGTVAIVSGVLLQDGASADLKRALTVFVAVIGFGIAFGYATLFLLSPIWMKLVHLALAHLIWACLVVVVERTLVRGAAG